MKSMRAWPGVHAAAARPRARRPRLDRLHGRLARRVAHLVGEPPDVHAPAVAEQPLEVLRLAVEPEPLARRGDRAEERSGDRQRAAACQPDHAGESDRPGPRDVHGAAHRVAHGGHDRLERVVDPHELDARVEAHVGRAHRLGEVPGDLSPEPGADRRLVAEHRAAHAGVAARVGVEVVLDLRDVALEARAQREHPRHLLPEELGRVRLGPVHAGGAAHDDRVERGHALAGGEQLERADDVDVVHRGRRHARARLPDDLLVDDRVDPGRRDQPPDLRVADVGRDELGALEGDLRAACVEADHVLDLGVALEPLRQEASDVAAHAGDQHPAAGH